MAVIVFRCSGCNRLIQLRENQRGVTSIGVCTATEGCSGTLTQVDRLQDRDVPAITNRIPGIANRQPRNVLYNHVQSIVSTTWTVTHNLNSNPVVQVAIDRPDGTRPEVTPESVEIVDSNTTRITFNRPESGVAQFLARTTNNEQQRVTAITGPELFQLSNDNFLTIATTDLTPSTINVDITFVEEGVEVPVVYSAEVPPDDESPWNDVDTVVIRGVEYRVRTIDLGDLAASPGIDEGSSFYFPSPNGIVLLLALSPYANVDRINRRVIFPTGIGLNEAAQSFAVTGNQLYAVETVIEEVYPPVFVVG